MVDSPRGKLLAEQAQGLKFKTQDPCRKSGMVGTLVITVLRRWEQAHSWDLLTGQSGLLGEFKTR